MRYEASGTGCLFACVGVCACACEGVRMRVRIQVRVACVRSLGRHAYASARHVCACERGM